MVALLHLTKRIFYFFLHLAFVVLLNTSRIKYLIPTCSVLVLLLRSKFGGGKSPTSRHGQCLIQHYDDSVVALFFLSTHVMIHVCVFDSYIQMC